MQLLILSTLLHLLLHIRTGTPAEDVAIENLYNPAKNPVCVAMFGLNIDIIIAGNVKKDDANIIGITPAIASFNGI